MRARAVGDGGPVDADADDVITAEAGILGSAGVRAAEHQRRPDHERERHRHLDHHQTGAQTESKPADADGSRHPLQLRVEIRPRRLERRRQPEEHDGQQRRADAEQQDAGVKRQVEGRHAIGSEAHEQRCDGLRDHHSERAACCRQQRALGQQLTDHASPRRTHCQPDRDLPPPGRGARQQHGCDVDTGDR
jgi:hypothetical protein